MDAASLDPRAPTPPPDFAGARTRRQKALSAGLDPNYWYACLESAVLHCASACVRFRE